MDPAASSSALRDLREGEAPRVTNMELFFDLVYVLTIIQLSHFLLDHLDWQGALQTLTLFAAVWWTWNYTAWAANWVNPEHPVGRALFITLMACALLMAIAIPQAFAGRGLLFAGAYVAMGLVRAFAMAMLFRGRKMGQNYFQLGTWSAIAGAFWLAGGWMPEHRLVLWMVAVLVDLAAPYAGFWLPGLGSTPMASWPLKGHHLLERNQLIFIIALGESVLLLGGTLAHGELNAGTLQAAGVGFLLIVMLWYLYFVRIPEGIGHVFRDGEDQASLARAGLAYAHGIMVAGAIGTAVAIELVLAHPHESVHAPTAMVAATGPVLFLVGSALFRHCMARRFEVAYVPAALLIAVWSWYAVHSHGSGLLLGAGLLAILGALAMTMPLISRARGS